MKAIRLHEIGGPEKLRLEEAAEPQAEPPQVVVRVRAAALNRRDLFITQGLYPNIRLPAILGADGAGEHNGEPVIIDPLIGWGEDERVWRADATILGMPLDGTFAQYVRVPQRNVHPKPEHLSFEEAAALPLAGVTAYRALFSRGELQRGETLLITGAGGGVQTFVLLYAKAAGARVIATSGSEEKLQHARALGADVAVNYHDEDWHKAARKAGPVDVIVDSMGGQSFAKALALVRPGGRVVTYGGTAGDATIKLFPVFWNQIDIRGSSMGSPADFAAMLRFVEQHRIRPVIDRIYNMDGIVEAVERLNGSGHFGKIVLRID